MKYNYYQLYGLSIKTTEEIEQLIPIEASDTTDLFLEIQEQQTEKEFPFEKEATKLYSSYGFAPNQIPYLTVWKQHDSEEAFLVIRYTNGQETAFFLIPKNAKQVKVLHHPLILVSDLITYFLGPVIGCVLKLKQKVCLHSSVVNIHGKAVAFIGAKTAGKSTLIATFAALGYPIVSDDIAVLFEKEGQHFVHLGYPRMRLWKNSIDPLPSIEIKNLKPVLSHLNKYYVPLSLEKRIVGIFKVTPFLYPKYSIFNPETMKTSFPLKIVHLRRVSSGSSKMSMQSISSKVI